MADKKHYAVTAVMIVAKVPGVQGGEAYLRQGAPLPAAIGEKEIKRLLDLGVIAEVPSLTEQLEAIEEQQAATAAADEAAFEARVAEAAAKIVADRDAAAAAAQTDGSNADSLLDPASEANTGQTPVPDVPATAETTKTTARKTAAK